jgi:hypothetical protein
MARHCAHCGAALGERGQFCHRCGAPRDGRPVASSTGSAAPATVSTILPWAVAGIALLSLLAYIVGQNFGRGPAAPAVAAAPVAAPASGRAPDISSMSPQERADRLFQRVMTYVSEGKSDSVTFFAPMAIQSFQALAPLDAHQRYDLGLLGLVSGDGELARAQADTILANNPTHLLGLILGMRSAGLQSDAAARADFVKRLSAALVSERAKGLQEYVDHSPDIDAAVREADGRTPIPGQSR